MSPSKRASARSGTAKRSRKTPELRARKLPTQQRARVTFDAIVDACTQLLAKNGYAATTTNHVAERAGVNIASLYEYFPGKDAIVAQVAERLVERVLKRLGRESASLRGVPESEATRLWIDLIYETVLREKRLVAVFTYEIPYTNDLQPMRTLWSQLLAFSETMRGRAGRLVRPDLSPAAMQLIVNLTSSTILQLVLDPPESPTTREVLDELSRRLDAWIRRGA